MTNLDWIRQMSDAELADLISTGDCYRCIVDESTSMNCNKCALNWLRKEREE